jgi:hypothetical protein
MRWQGAQIVGPRWGGDLPILIGLEAPARSTSVVGCCLSTSPTTSLPIIITISADTLIYIRNSNTTVALCMVFQFDNMLLKTAVTCVVGSRVDSYAAFNIIDPSIG